MAFFDKVLDVKPVISHRLELASYVLRFLQYNFIWTPTPRSVRSALLFFAFLLFGNLILLGFWMQIIHYCLTTPKFEYVRISNSTAMLVSSISVYQTFIPFYFSQTHIRALLRDMGDFRVSVQPSGLARSDAVMNLLCKLIFIMLYTSAPLCFGYYLLEDCTTISGPRDTNYYTCGLVYPAYFPRLMTPTGRHVLLTVQIGSAWLLMAAVFACNWLYMHLSEVIVAYCKHLQRMIDDVQFGEERQREIRRIVRYHHRILGFHAQYNDLARTALLMHILWAPLILATFMYTFTTELRVPNLLHVTLWVDALFIVCVAGQRLIDESLEIANATYRVVGFDGDRDADKCMQLVMLRSQRMLFVPAGRLTIYSHTLFVIAIKTTYSYLTLLQTTGGQTD